MIHFVSYTKKAPGKGADGIVSKEKLQPQLVGIQALEFVDHEQAVFTDKLVVEPDFAAAVFRPLNQHQIPVDGALVSVVAVVIAVAGRKMD